MISKASLRAAFLALSLLAAGCTQDVGEPPPLSRAQVNAVMRCQETIKREGRQFVNRKLHRVELCLDRALDLMLQLENEVITQSRFDRQMEIARRLCTNHYNSVARQSTNLINNITRACSPVEDIIFSDYNPLQFRELIAPLFVIEPGVFGFQLPEDADAEELAGLICVAKEVYVDFMLFAQVPRMPGILQALDETDPVPPFGDGIPLIPLDERCTADFVEDFIP